MQEASESARASESQKLACLEKRCQEAENQVKQLRQEVSNLQAELQKEKVLTQLRSERDQLQLKLDIALSAGKKMVSELEKSQQEVLDYKIQAGKLLSEKEDLLKLFEEPESCVPQRVHLRELEQ